MANAAQRPDRCGHADTAFTYDLEIKYFSWAEGWIDPDIHDWKCVSSFPESCQNISDGN